MSFNYSKGAQVIGDLKAADDAQRDTKIDFGEDQIDFHTSGSMKMQIANDGITTTLPVHISGSAVEGLRIAKGGSDYRAIVFEVDGADNANISVSNAENFVIQNEMNGKDIQFWVNPSAGSSVQAITIKESGLVGIGTDAPDYELDVAGNIGVNQYIYHNGDANTWINFTDNRIRLNAGGNNFIDCEDPGSAPHKVRINNGGNNIDFVIKDSSGNAYFTADASTSRIGIGAATPIAELDVAGKIAITAESSTPGQPSDGQGYLYSKSDGKIYWRSHDLSETDLTATGDGGGGGGGGGDEDESFNTINGATGVVDHDCSSKQSFLHENIADSFTVNLTNFSVSSGEVAEVKLYLVQGATARFPTGIKIGGNLQEFSWKSESYPTPTAFAEEVVTFKILNNGGNYLVLADVDSYASTVPISPITSGSVLFLDGSNTGSYNNSGTTWTDLSGDNKHGTLTNGVTFSNSTKLFSFDGSNDYIALPSGFADFTSGITLFFVADFADQGPAFERLIDLGNGAETDNILFCRNNNNTNDLQYSIRDGANGNTNLRIAEGILNNTLASYAATDDGTTIKLYRNSVLVGTGTSNIPRNVTRNNNYLARSNWNDGYLGGTLGVAAVYDRVLTEEELKQNHNYYVGIYSL